MYAIRSYYAHFFTRVDPFSESPTNFWNSTAFAVEGDAIHAAHTIPMKTVILMMDMVSPRKNSTDRIGGPPAELERFRFWNSSIGTWRFRGRLLPKRTA